MTVLDVLKMFRFRILGAAVVVAAIVAGGSWAVSNWPQTVLAPGVAPDGGQSSLVVSVQSMPSDGGSPALPSGAATAANQVTGNNSLATIATAVTTGPVPVSVGSLALPTGASTSALQTSGNASLSTIASGEITPGTTFSTQPGPLTQCVNNSNSTGSSSGTTNPIQCNTSGELRVQIESSNTAAVVNAGNSSAFTGLGVMPAKSVSAPASETANYGQPLYTDANNGAELVELVGNSTSRITAGAGNTQSYSTAVGLSALTGYVPSSISAVTSGYMNFLEESTANGGLVVDLYGTGTSAIASSTNGGATPGTGLQVMPAQSASLSAIATGNLNLLNESASNGALWCELAGTGTSAITSGTNNSTAGGTGLQVFPAIAYGAPGALTAGYDQLLTVDAATSGLFDVSIPTTAAAAVSSALVTVNTAQAIKASAGNLYGFSLYNPAATVCYVQIYNSSSAPTCGTSVIQAYPIPPTSALNLPPNLALYHATSGIGFCFSTTASGSTTCGSSVAGEVFFE